MHAKPSSNVNGTQESQADKRPASATPDADNSTATPESAVSASLAAGGGTALPAAVASSNVIPGATGRESTSTVDTLKGNGRSQAFKPTADRERLREQRLTNAEERRNKKRLSKLLELRMNRNPSEDASIGLSDDQKEIAGLSKSIEEKLDELTNDIANEIKEGASALGGTNVGVN